MVKRHLWRTCNLIAVARPMRPAEPRRWSCCVHAACPTATRARSNAFTGSPDPLRVPATEQSYRAVGFGIGVHVARFGVIMLGLELAPLLGITGWYAGRFAWIVPLMLIHGLADFTTILTSGGLGDLAVVGTLVLFVTYGILVIRGACLGVMPNQSVYPGDG